MTDLGRLGDAREFERVVVTYDDLHWGNSFLRDIVAEDFAETPFTHFASIAEFEYLLGACRQSTLPALLRRKRLGAEGAAAMDFRTGLGVSFRTWSRAQTPFSIDDTIRRWRTGACHRS